MKIKFKWVKTRWIRGKGHNLEVGDEAKLKKRKKVKAKIKEDEERTYKSNTPELELTESENKIKDVNFLK